jgi:hypothetical protein
MLGANTPRSALLEDDVVYTVVDVFGNGREETYVKLAEKLPIWEYSILLLREVDPPTEVNLDELMEEALEETIMV